MGQEQLSYGRHGETRLVRGGVELGEESDKQVVPGGIGSGMAWMCVGHSEG